jgi:Tol biopolymer transport system component
MPVNDNGKLEIYTASPVGSAFKRYQPAVLENVGFFNTPLVQFSPDGHTLTAVTDAVGGRQAWQLPWPPDKGTPRRIWPALPGDTRTNIRWSWFPDGRNGVMAFGAAEGTHMWFMGVRSGLLRQLTSGTVAESESSPAISPDGKKILFTKVGTDYMIVSASLADAQVHRVLSSGMQTGMAAWARHKEAFVYEGGQSGRSAVWMMADGVSRPIVTAAQFPAGTSNDFFTPALSPQADRVMYGRVDTELHFQNWISSVSGGPPVRLTNAKYDVERGGAWSPDGSTIVYWLAHNAQADLMIVKASGEAAPALLRAKIGNPLPDWSPDGRWISFADMQGWHLISPDGKTVRDLGDLNAGQITFSADSKLIYGIRAKDDKRTLFSMDIETKATKNIGEIARDFTPSSYSNPGTRLSLSPDGKSILYPAFLRSNSLWMLEGFETPGWRDRFREMVPW